MTLLLAELMLALMLGLWFRLCSALDPLALQPGFSLSVTLRGRQATKQRWVDGCNAALAAHAAPEPAPEPAA